MQLTVVFINTFCISPSKATFHIEQFQKSVLGWAKMRIDDMNDAQDPYRFEENAMVENVIVGNDET